MNEAERIWKSEYIVFHYRFAPLRTRKKSRKVMQWYRREAALERRLATQQRTIEAQAQRIEALEHERVEMMHEF